MKRLLPVSFLMVVLVVMTTVSEAQSFGLGLNGGVEVGIGTTKSRPLSHTHQGECSACCRSKTVCSCPQSTTRVERKYLGEKVEVFEKRTPIFQEQVIQERVFEGTPRCERSEYCIPASPQQAPKPSCVAPTPVVPTPVPQTSMAPRSLSNPLSTPSFRGGPDADYLGFGSGGASPRSTSTSDESFVPSTRPKLKDGASSAPQRVPGMNEASSRRGPPVVFTQHATFLGVSFVSPIPVPAINTAR